MRRFIVIRQLSTPNGFSPSQMGMGNPTSITWHLALAAGMLDLVQPQRARDHSRKIRVCTGQYLGENSVWISIASILASCTITNAVDENGQIVVPETRMSDGLVRCVNIVTPTSAEANEMLQPSE
jgi:hypothetical protein